MEMTPLNPATGQCHVNILLSGISTSKRFCDGSSHIIIEECYCNVVAMSLLCLEGLQNLCKYRCT